MRRRSVYITVLLVLVLLLPTLLGCGEESDLRSGPGELPQDEGCAPRIGDGVVVPECHRFGQPGPRVHRHAGLFQQEAPRPPLKIISIADLDAKVFYHEVPSIYDLVAAQPVYAEDKLDLRWDDYDRWYRTDNDSYRYSLRARGDTIGFTFDLSQDKEPLMVGGDGLIDWTEGSTYYYSLTRLQVTGQIEIDGETIDVTGIGWMDHQWMDTIAEKGWRWFSIQLDDQTDIICWNICDLDGTVESSDLTMMQADGSIYHTTDLQLGPHGILAVAADRSRPTARPGRFESRSVTLTWQITARFPNRRSSCSRKYRNTPGRYGKGDDRLRRD